MTRRVVRAMFALLVAGALAAAAQQAFELNRKSEQHARTDRELMDLTDTIDRAIAELGQAQQAYVAAGQGVAFWSTRVDTLVGFVREKLEHLKLRAGAGEPGAALEAASGLVDDFEQLDRRAGEFARSGQQLMASDLIFTDGQEMLRSLSSLIDGVRRGEFEARKNALDASERTTGLVMALAALLILGGLAALVLSSGEAEPVAGPRVVGPAASPGDKAAEVEARAVPVLPQPPPAPPAPAGPDIATQATLRAVAELCTDLGRVSDAAELPGLLERSAKILDASGILIWVADSPGGDLRPVLAHGYPPQALARIQPITGASENATAAAYRDGRVEIVRTDGSSNGAITAPLLTSAGCIGVVAAEVRNGAECKPSLQSMTRIIAAQLATLVAPPPTVKSARSGDPELSRRVTT
jgi:hypothetical protein